MSGAETGDVIEWRAKPGWVLSWLAFLVFVALPFLGWGASLAAHEIAGAPEGTWPAYIFFLQAFATLIFGILGLAALSGVVAHVMLLIDRRPVVRADRSGIEVHMPLRRTRQVRWDEIRAIEIERKRQVGRRVVHYNHLQIRLRDETAPELVVKPQMAGLSLEYGHNALVRLQALYR